MSSYQGDDRRHAPRVASRLPLTLTDHFGELSAMTRDISASGAYCTLRRHVPVMTKLRIRFALPGRGQGAVACGGVVVRVEPANPAPRRTSYRVAIFFNNIAEDARARLADYVHEHLKPRGTRHR